MPIVTELIICVEENENAEAGRYAYLPRLMTLRTSLVPGSHRCKPNTL